MWAIRFYLDDHRRLRDFPAVWITLATTARGVLLVSSQGGFAQAQKTPYSLPSAAPAGTYSAGAQML